MITKTYKHREPCTKTMTMPMFLYNNHTLSLPVLTLGVEQGPCTKTMYHDNDDHTNTNQSYFDCMNRNLGRRRV